MIPIVVVVTGTRESLTPMDPLTLRRGLCNARVGRYLFLFVSPTLKTLPHFENDESVVILTKGCTRYVDTLIPEQTALSYS